MFFLFLTLVSVIALSSCQKSRHTYIGSIGYQNKPPATYKDLSGQSAAGHDIKAIDLRALTDLDMIISRLAEKQVVFIGEIHDRLDHHLAQLEIIQALHAIHDDLVIGVEYFQTPFQQHLDAYVAGDLDERAFLKKTEYFGRWSFDYRLYRPIMKYARKHRIPLIAINLPTEISRKVGRSGVDSLSDDEKAQIPSEIDRSDDAYRERLRSVFEAHRQKSAGLTRFDYFVEAQLLWDEAMADNAANYLRRNPTRHMIILAGNGHLLYGSGIPRRLTRRLPVKTAIVINAGQEAPDPDMADFLLLPTKVSLTSPGMLGIVMQKHDNGVVIEDLVSGGAAMNAGLAKGDELVEIDGNSVRTMADVKLALLDMRPRDQVTVVVRRSDANSGTRLIDFNVTLSAPQ